MGLIPSWSRDPSAGTNAFNARAETIAEKPFFRHAFRKKRCLIPASGYYEWEKTGKTKQPYWFHPVKGDLLAFAGLWETWGEGETIESCAIITTAANEMLRPFHDRMPVILPAMSFSAWLDEKTPLPTLHDMLKSSEMVTYHAVGPGVGNVRNQGPELIAPA